MKKRIMGLLLVVAIMAAQVSMLPVFAEVADGNKIDTVDALWEAVGSAYKVLPTKDDSPAKILLYQSNDHDAYIDYENGTSGNVVIKLGKKATETAEATKIGRFTSNGLKNLVTKKQKWEAKVKIANPAESSVYLMGYNVSATAGGTQNYLGDGTNGVGGTAILFENGQVKLKELTQGNNIATGSYEAMTLDHAIAADKWYRVVRYMDFTEFNPEYSTAEKNTGVNRQRVLIYEIDENGAEALIGDSEDNNTPSENWMWAGRYKAQSDYSDTLNFAVGSFDFDAQAATGDVMIDDIAAYEITDSDPGMACTPSWSISKETDGAALFADSNTAVNLTSGGSAGYINTNGIEASNYYFSNISGSKAYVAKETEQSDNDVIMLGRADGFAPGIIANNEMYTFASDMTDLTKIHKYETKIKFADAANTVAYVLGYSQGTGAAQQAWYTSDTGTSASAVKFNNGTVQCRLGIGSNPQVKAYSNVTYNGSPVTIESNVWYKVVRYVNINVSTGQTHYSKELIYRVDNNGTQNETETLIYDSGEYKKTFWRSANSDPTTLKPSVVSTYVDSASGRVMIDDMKACYVSTETTNYSIDNGTNMPVEIPDREITFNTLVNESTFDESKITLTANGEAVDFDDVTFADNKITLDFPTLDYNTNYTLTIAKDVIKDEFNRTLVADIVYNFTTAKLLEVSSPALVDGDGNPLTTLPAQGAQVKGAVTLINPNDIAGDYLIIVACYNGNRFLGAVCEDGTVSNTPAEGTTITTAETLTIPADCTKVSVMVWKGWSSVKPLVEKFTLGQ